MIPHTFDLKPCYHCYEIFIIPYDRSILLNKLIFSQLFWGGSGFSKTILCYHKYSLICHLVIKVLSQINYPAVYVL